MKTSSEIKAFIIERLDARDPMELYFEFFRQIEENSHDKLSIKAVQSRWQCACREVSKELGWKGLDETFPKSIFCYNAYMNALQKGDTDKYVRWIKQELGWDVKTIAEGKHCNIAQIIIDVLQENFINKQMERLGLYRGQDELSELKRKVE